MSAKRKELRTLVKKIGIQLTDHWYAEQKACYALHQCADAWQIAQSNKTRWTKS